MEEMKIKIRPSNDVSPGNFKTDPLVPGGYIANPVTIRAMKKDIFLEGNDIDQTQKIYYCDSCKKELDLQFWHFCPYCESSLKNAIQSSGTVGKSRQRFATACRCL